MKRYYTILLTLVIGLSCSTIKMEYKEDFEHFYKRFYSDKDFQRSRITFPLQQRSESISGISTTAIPSEKWQVIYTIPKDTIINGSKYKKELTVTNDKVVQRIFIPNSGFQNICTFQQIRGKWMLVSISSTNF